MSKADSHPTTKPIDKGAVALGSVSAYSRLEARICDLADMATIASEAFANADGPSSEAEKSTAAFAVYHLADMVHELRRQYYAWGGADADLANAASELQTLDRKIADIHRQFGDTADKRPDYQDAANRRREVIALLAESPSTSQAGILAKAGALHLDPLLEDETRALAVAKSLAADIERLADKLDVA